jgi:glycosyltransferase involved in cell wall biosynthesis
MNILHVLAGMDPKLGGVCQAVRTMANGLIDLGVTNEVVSLDAADSSFLKDDSFRVHALGPASGPWSYSPLLLPWLVENLCRFDIVIVHGLWLYYGHAVKKAIQSDTVRRQLKEKRAAGSTTKLFVMPHGMLDPYFQRAPGRKLKALRNWAYWKLIESKLVENADGLLFTCEEELLLARKPFRPYHPKRELNVGLGIEHPPAFSQDMTESFLKKCPEVRNSPYILFLSRIHEKKGVDLLINAYAKVYEKGSPKLVIAGPGYDSPYGQKLKELINENGKIKDAVLFPGMLSGDSKWGAFYGCDAFVLPSHQENFGIAVAEALACCKPVLISNQVNIWREIQEGNAGIVAADTIEGTIDLLERWTNLNTDKKIEMATDAGKLFERSFAIASVASHLMISLGREKF